MAPTSLTGSALAGTVEFALAAALEHASTMAVAEQRRGNGPCRRRGLYPLAQRYVRASVALEAALELVREIRASFGTWQQAQRMDGDGPADDAALMAEAVALARLVETAGSAPCESGATA